MGICNLTSKPKFTSQQIAECRECRKASAKGRWCGRFGCWIIRPGGKIVRPFPKNNAEYNKNRFNREYVIAVDMAKGSGKPVVDEAAYVKKRKKCAVCPPEDKQGCPCVGCKHWQELVFAKVKCPKNK